MAKELVHFYDWLVYHPYKKPSAEIDFEYLGVTNHFKMPSESMS